MQVHAVSEVVLKVLCLSSPEPLEGFKLLDYSTYLGTYVGEQPANQWRGS